MLDKFNAFLDAAKQVAANSDCLNLMISKCCTHKSPKKHAYFLKYLIILSLIF